MMKKMTKKMDNDIQMDNYIQMTKKLKTKKFCNHVYLKTMGKFIANMESQKSIHDTER